MIRFAVVLIALTACFSTSVAQRNNPRMQMATALPTICYASGKNEFTTVGPPADYLAWKANRGSARTATTNFEVDYEGFTTEAQAAFQEAVDIWASLLQSPVTIRIHARWTPLATGVLGSAGPGSYVRNFAAAPDFGAWYPIAVAEKIAGVELNASDDYDIEATFNSTQSAWHFGLTGSNPPAGKYDLVSIVLHEIGHGLGITHAYDVVNNQAVIPSYFDGTPVVYETNIQAADGTSYVGQYTPPSTALKNVITSRALFYSSDLVKGANGGLKASLYAPATYVSGSSIAHLDETTYLAGNINSLMTPAIGAAERILDPGPIVKAILKDVGWINTRLDHTPLKDTENTSGPFHVVVKVKSDVNGYNVNSVTLAYWVDNDQGTFAFLSMHATANADEYAVDLPTGHQDYNYWIQLNDNDGREFYNVPLLVVPGGTPFYFQDIHFHAGPDVTPPVITHTKKEFITNIDDFAIDATVTDNIGVDNVKVQWKLNGDVQTDKTMMLTSGSTSLYETVITKNNFTIGDTIEYRIRAEDVAVASNVSYNPTATAFNMVIVAGLGETKKSYANNFNDLSTADFFGSGFTIVKDANFDGHIMSSPSPYPVGGSVGAHVDLIYTLKSPIHVASKDATIKFDEIVLVEPGEDGAVWPSEDFYDYVVVEGSIDGGTTWIAIADGYDCAYNSTWKDLWNNNFDGTNSTAVGTPALYRPHEFNMLDKFSAGDEVAIRFRLYSDPFSAGWGWAIDNLKIQIDETPPAIRHQHFDYLMNGTTSITLDMKIDDTHGPKQIFVDYNVNGGTTTSAEIIVNPASDLYSPVIDLTALGLDGGDEFQYRIRAIDSVGNVGTFPESGDFITTAIISLESPLDEIVATFATQSPNLTGNFFDVVVSGNDGRMSTDHPYNTGLGIDGISEFTFMTKKAIKVSALNPRIYYEDIALVEYSGSKVKDYVVVEASKDGVTWKQLVEPYAANYLSSWKSMYDVGGSPTSSTALTSHQFDLTTGGNFKAGDAVLVRFRLHSDSLKSGWGWAIDNLNIQSSITGLEPQYGTGNSSIACPWPNPVVGNSMYLKLNLPSASDISVEILNTQGQVVSTDQFSSPSGDFQREYDASNWSNGLYLVKVKSVFGTSVTKLIKLK
ncbi:MAG: T9SS type A sorting domain-containing protein [Bacteroidota bacterium]